MSTRDLTFKLEDMAQRTPGVISVVHASTDGLRKHHTGLAQEAAERQAAAASSLRTAAMTVPAESVPALASGQATMDFLSFETPPTDRVPGTRLMLTQPADGALLLVVADERCPAPVLAQALVTLGKQVAEWWETAPRATGSSPWGG